MRLTVYRTCKERCHETEDIADTATEIIQTKANRKTRKQLISTSLICETLLRGLT